MNYNSKRCPACQDKKNRATVQAASRKYAREMFKVDGLDALKLHPNRTHRDVGQEMGISHERVRQLENRALQKLRANAGFVAETYGIILD